MRLAYVLRPIDRWSQLFSPFQQQKAVPLLEHFCKLSPVALGLARQLGPAGQIDAHAELHTPRQSACRFGATLP